MKVAGLCKSEFSAISVKVPFLYPTIYGNFIRRCTVHCAEKCVFRFRKAKKQKKLTEKGEEKSLHSLCNNEAKTSPSSASVWITFVHVLVKLRADVIRITLSSLADWGNSTPSFTSTSRKNLLFLSRRDRQQTTTLIVTSSRPTRKEADNQRSTSEKCFSNPDASKQSMSRELISRR